MGAGLPLTKKQLLEGLQKGDEKIERKECLEFVGSWIPCGICFRMYGTRLIRASLVVGRFFKNLLMSSPASVVIHSLPGVIRANGGDSWCICMWVRSSPLGSVFFWF